MTDWYPIEGLEKHVIRKIIHDILTEYKQSLYECDKGAYNLEEIENLDKKWYNDKTELNEEWMTNFLEYQNEYSACRVRSKGMH